MARRMRRARFNHCTFIGNLGADPELRETSNGTSVTNIRLASTNQWTDRQTGERQERTTWIPAVAWRSYAENIVKACRKGDLVLLHGSMQENIRKIDDRTITSLELVINDWQILDALSDADYFEADSTENKTVSLDEIPE